MSVLVTGASGFIGRRLTSELAHRGLNARLAVRHGKSLDIAPRFASVTVHGAGMSAQDWADAMRGCSHVIHLAARAHVLDERDADPTAAFRAANVQMAAACAQAAAEAGVRRFVFTSSIGVHGSATSDLPFEVKSPLAPDSPYAASKAEAEHRLQDIARVTGLELVSIRPPLVYGPQAPGNFGTLLKVLARQLPLPLGAVTHNRRSLVALDNLVDMLITCLDHPAAAHQTFLLADGEDLSTAELLRRLGQAMGKPARLWPVPPAVLQAGATLLGKRDTAHRLLGNLQVDITHTRETLGWTPPISVDEGLRRAAAGLVAP